MSRPASAAFHAGELQAQALAGFSTSGAAIRDFMPEQHRAFFAAQKFLLLATIDEDGWPLATVVAGDPGFIKSPDQHTLLIHAAANSHDPVLAQISVGSAVGMLGIDFRTRRRNRANGVVSAVDDGRLRIDIHQSFGNCPKYINVRDIGAATAPIQPTAAVPFAGLDAAARDTIAKSDTFFVATASGRQQVAGGVDISHRGGAVGFIKVLQDTLICPDYLGNRYFNTLGNMMVEPRAALLFMDFSNGDLLHLRGRAEILWSSVLIQDFPGAERLWRFRVEQGLRRVGSGLIEN
jgi:predicted pyridoxine 5'-phosphate oxidase superfamily flavin-nucleotide-binding protein